MSTWRAFATLQEVALRERGGDPLQVLDDAGWDFEMLRVAGAVECAPDGTCVRTDCSFADAARRSPRSRPSPPCILDDPDAARDLVACERASERNP